MKKIFSTLSFVALLATSQATAHAQAPARSLDEDLCLRDYDVTAERSLLDRGAHVDAVCDDGYPVLADALTGGHFDTAKLLLERGARVEARFQGGQTPLFTAASTDRPELVQILLDHKANVNARDDNGVTPIMRAAKAQAVSLLLQHGAHADDKDQNGTTVLMKAAMYGHADSIQLLLDHGAHVNDKNSYGTTALLQTASMAWTDALSVLLDHGANIQDTNKDGSTALIVAASRCLCDSYRPAAQYERYITLLLDKGIAIDATDNDGRTAVIGAAEKGRTSIIKVLLARGANPDIADKNGNTALSLVTKLNLPEAIAMLDPGQPLRLSLEQKSWNNPQEQFDAYRDACVQYPSSTSMRKKLLELAATLPTPPPTPVEARQYLLQASQQMKLASTPDALLAPIALLRKAIEIASWWPNAYYNLSVALELSGKYNEAESQLNFYLTAKPDDTQARTRLKAIQTERDAAAQAKP